MTGIKIDIGISVRAVFLFLGVLPGLLFADSVSEVYFSSGGELDQKLISWIEAEKEEIHSAIYQITNKKIANALIEAQKRGVKVHVITHHDASSKAYYRLVDSDVDIKLYQPVGAMDRGMLHHKYMLFKSNQDGKSYVWTGSANFTQSGCNRNRENAVVIEGSETYDKFLEEFQEI